MQNRSVLRLLKMIDYAKYFLLKEPSIDYLLSISDKLETYMNDNEIEFVYSKGKRKSEIQKLYDELKKNALKLWEYAIHLDTLGERETAVLKQIMM